MMAMLQLARPHTEAKCLPQRALPLDVRAVLGVALPQRALRLAHKLLAALFTRDEVHDTRVSARGRGHELVLLPRGAALEVGALLQPRARHARLLLAPPRAGETVARGAERAVLGAAAA